MFISKRPVNQRVHIFGGRNMAANLTKGGTWAKMPKASGLLSFLRRISSFTEKNSPSAIMKTRFFQPGPNPSKNALSHA